MVRFHGEKDIVVNRYHVTSQGRVATRIRHLKLADAIINKNMTYKDALLEAGYPLKTATNDCDKIVRSAMPVIQEVLEKAGITPEIIAAKAKDLLDAKQYSPVNRKEGVETWEAPDHRVQQRHLELVTEMLGMRRWGMPGQMHTQNLVQVNVSFGGNATSAPAGDGKAFPVQVKVTNNPPSQEMQPGEVELTPGVDGSFERLEQEP